MRELSADEYAPILDSRRRECKSFIEVDLQNFSNVGRQGMGLRPRSNSRENVALDSTLLQEEC